MNTRPRNLGQKFAYVCAIVSALASIPAFGLFLWLRATRGMADTWTPSAISITLFFLSCAAVLYVVSRPGKMLQTRP